MPTVFRFYEFVVLMDLDELLIIGWGKDGASDRPDICLHLLIDCVSIRLEVIGSLLTFVSTMPGRRATEVTSGSSSDKVLEGE